MQYLLRRSWAFMCSLRPTIAIILLGLAPPICIASHALLVTARIQTSRSASVINPEIYGQFIEHEGTQIYNGIWVGRNSSIPNIDGYRKDLIQALKRIYVPVIRWPGGCFADQYDWRDGIGPESRRPIRINRKYANTIESNKFGTQEFLDFAELIGAEPYIGINMASTGPLQASRWIQYMTDDNVSSLANERRENGRAQPWKIKYVGLGNEAWGCGGNMRAEFAADMTRLYASAIDEFGTHHLIMVASGPSANLGTEAYQHFTSTMMENNSTVFGTKIFQALSLHYYAFPIALGDKVATIVGHHLLPLTPATGFGEKKWANTLRSALGMENAITTVSSIMDKYDPKRSVGLYVDEWGSWHKNEPGTDPWSFYQQSSLLDAEVTALTLNIFQRHTDRVKLACNSEMVNALHAIILTRGVKLLLTPSYYVFQMYLPFRGATPYVTSVSAPAYVSSEGSLPSVDISAAKGRDGHIYLALVNLEPYKAADVQTNLQGSASGIILTGPTLDSHNAFDSPEVVHPAAFVAATRNRKVLIKMPPRSIVVVAVH